MSENQKSLKNDDIIHLKFFLFTKNGEADIRISGYWYKRLLV